MRFPHLARRVVGGMIAAAVIAVTATPVAAQADVKDASAQSVPYVGAKFKTRSANVQPDVVKQADGTEKVITIDSGYMRGVYCELADDGFNAVTLTWAIEQTSKTSGKLVPRKQAPGTAPTPTDGQIRRAIRSAKTCGISRVIIKEHIWLPGNEWRAHIPGTTRNQAAWTTRLLHLQKLALEERAYEVVMATEQRDSTTTSGDATRWKRTIATLRKADPKHQVRLTMALHNPDELLLVAPSLVRATDGVYSTYYPRPAGWAKLSTYDLRADMQEDKGHFDKAHDLFGDKFEGFAESGFRSIYYGDYFDVQGSKPRVDEGLQARQYAAFFDFVKTLRGVDTLMLYRAQAGGTDPAGFAWHDKDAHAVIRAAFLRR